MTRTSLAVWLPLSHHYLNNDVTLFGVQTRVLAFGKFLKVVNSISVLACRRLIRKWLSTDQLSIDRVANKLSLPIRTLQRRLQTADLTFKQLVDEVRLEEACRLLKNPNVSLQEVARAVGFKDPSNFNRAFKRWTQQTPKEYRIQLRGSPDKPH